ncbi:hypothetical protein BGZ61DRAFT_5191 [Ilyonectria robusta]|jgi:hypothetical protein|uniref:uncharacterized protein n=1 Tax=Ilyonectria robusta TaxID=1079257 RepID=UPI001E8D74CE|nr:uncharacterized protein BGZ61DRAFT_5191 [Ilyonectria robusta]KAH8736911.1 hypothetical protein BGZ61DRAFT_5191 [Ilyonectria robusta]
MDTYFPSQNNIHHPVALAAFALLLHKTIILPSLDELLLSIHLHLMDILGHAPLHALCHHLTNHLAWFGHVFEIFDTWFYIFSVCAILAAFEKDHLAAICFALSFFLPFSWLSSHPGGLGWASLDSPVWWMDVNTLPAWHATSVFGL